MPAFAMVCKIQCHWEVIVTLRHYFIHWNIIGWLSHHANTVSSRVLHCDVRGNTSFAWWDCIISTGLLHHCIIIDGCLGLCCWALMGLGRFSPCLKAPSYEWDSDCNKNNQHNSNSSDNSWWQATCKFIVPIRHTDVYPDHQFQEITNIAYLQMV